ncbi:uncharacterized protein LOC115632949 isoform X2 [Scaptodrosophila lebanonensis]|uniref:Uncharacterized protein LOC115632949 isoform X2 n=1 Tax=Drosophila lebanonensis TaxID=7225 RepID=A0A6J2UFD1_DROLE|nr:uncharacterized protein LOC115632949 isoform X2 [Scaptodrosophila lebanonensis]
MAGFLKPFIKLEAGEENAITSVTPAGIVINKIPAEIKPSMKRDRVSTTTTTGVTAPLLKSPKYMLQTSISNMPSSTTSLQWQSTLGDIKKGHLGTAISLPPNTIIKATTRPAAVGASSNSSSIGNGNNNMNAKQVLSNISAVASSIASTLTSSTTSNTPAVGSVASPVRQTFFIKREVPQRTMRGMTLNLIENNPMLHLGIQPDRLALLKRTICRTANVTHLDCCIALKKLRQNESFSLLGEYFEYSEADVESIFTRTLVKMARYLRHLIRWPDSKRYYERLKYLPLAYRRNLLHMQSLIECVETEVSETLNLGCSSYKFILCINTNCIISFISNAYRGDCDDLQLFEATNFKAAIPKYLTLCGEPGKSVPRTHSNKSRRAKVTSSTAMVDTDSLTDSADEDADLECSFPSEDRIPISKFDAQRLTGSLASMQTLKVVDGNLTSTRAPSIRVPTLNVHEPACRAQMRDMVDALRQFKMLAHCGIQQASLFSYLNEMLIVAAALNNLQR